MTLPESLQRLGLEPEVAGLSPPLTPEQKALAEQFELNLVYLPDGQACLQERLFHHRWYLPVYKQQRRWFYQRVLSALKHVPKLVSKYGFDQAVLGFYALFPTKHHPALTKWLLSVPDKACVFCYAFFYRDLRLPQVGSLDRASDERIDSTLFDLRYVELPPIPLKYCQPFPVAGDDGIQLLYVPTDQPLRYSLARLLGYSQPEPRKSGELCRDLLAIVPERPHIKDAVLAIVQELLRRTGLFSATRLALAMEELESLLGDSGV
ncbi:MAG: hypothetical protein NZ482_03650 [Gloeomargarita sp. SKYG98]|nr:hypothetical protein [Gloeomargarita sp. SKYG98]